MFYAYGCISMLRYLDWTAKIHTDTPQKKSRINVDYIHVNALLGYVEGALIEGILSLNLDRKTESAAIAAFNKLLWIQNDYFAKYYVKNPVSSAATPATTDGSLISRLSQCSLAQAAIGALVGGAAIYLAIQKRYL